MMLCYVAVTGLIIFLYFSNPTHNYSAFNTTWPLFDNKTMEYMDIGNTLTLQSVNEDDNFNFWDQLYTSIGAYISYDVDDECESKV